MFKFYFNVAHRFQRFVFRNKQLVRGGHVLGVVNRRHVLGVVNRKLIIIGNLYCFII